MVDSATLLVEIGTEELPAGLAHTLAFQRRVAEQLQLHGFLATVDDSLPLLATPRRLAACLPNVLSVSPPRVERKRGPRVTAPEKAVQGFASSAGVSVDALRQRADDRGVVCWYADCHIDGEALSSRIQLVVDAVMAALPLPQTMRWGDGEAAFVRPVRWTVGLHGDTPLHFTVCGIASGTTTYGHRVHGTGEIAVPAAEAYVETLRAAHVLVDWRERYQSVANAVTTVAEQQQYTIAHVGLLDEVTDLVEWPVAHLAHFDRAFSVLPSEVITAVLCGHQRYFPTRDGNGKLTNAFVFVANLDSSDPPTVVQGNERVIAPRLYDAKFFWDKDTKTSLAQRFDALANVVWHDRLGNLQQKSERLVALVNYMAQALAMDGASLQQAARLSKCDLLTGMVGEFPELQGIIGARYARHNGEPQAVCDALREQYVLVPQTSTGAVLALADRLDTLTGFFAVGLRPTGDADPFALRRAAIGIVRLLTEHEQCVPLLLEMLQQQAERGYASLPNVQWPQVHADVRAFLLERWYSVYADAPFAGFLRAAAGARHDHTNFARLRAQAEQLSLQPPDKLADLKRLYQRLRFFAERRSKPGFLIEEGRPFKTIWDFLPEVRDEPWVRSLLKYSMAFFKGSMLLHTLAEVHDNLYAGLSTLLDTVHIEGHVEERRYRAFCADVCEIFDCFADWSQL